MKNIEDLWSEIYDNGEKSENTLKKIKQFVKETKNEQKEITIEKDWYKSAVIYSLYVDLYAGDFKGLKERLSYLQNLGVNTLWLLPILSSPMNDQGFDISNYYKVREDLGTNEDFFEFIEEAHKKGIKVLFDMALNHTSDQHKWFQEAKKDKGSKYRDYYIWNEDQEKYKEARLLFKGMINSNWEYNKETDDYYFHRFYGFQPDLNYKNPEVLYEIIKRVVFWKSKGVDGLRLDAIPFIWKEEGTNCENLPKTHKIIKLIRAVVDYIQPGTLLLAEANMKPKDVVDYFGNGDECQAAYHFPLMPKFYLALAEGDSTYIKEVLSNKVTPDIPENAQWLSFLRCHDELTLEFVTPEEREKMNKYYLKDEKYSFREGEGISGRLYNLLDGDIQKIHLINSLMLTTIGSSIIYYGDEVGMENNHEFYEKMTKKTGYKDSRFYNRGEMNWEKVKKALNDKESEENEIFEGLKEMIKAKVDYKEFFKKDPEYLDVEDKELFVVKRELDGKELIIFHNLSKNLKEIKFDTVYNILEEKDVKDKLVLMPNEYVWLLK
ncbi:MAG: alpha-amylase family glycosyl hydrolase [Fusobacteriota bacterium]